MSNREPELLRYAAERAAGRSFFLASVLREYQELHTMDDEQLARELGCEPADLPRLRLCRRPDPAPGSFRADVERIAAHFGLSPIALARMVREVDAARKLRPAAPDREAGGLLAARDREPAHGDGETGGPSDEGTERRGDTATGHEAHHKDTKDTKKR